MGMYSPKVIIVSTFHPQALEGAFYLYEKGVGEEVRISYLQLAQSLEEYVGKIFNEWIALVEKELHRHLETPLMQRSVQSK